MPKKFKIRKAKFAYNIVTGNESQIDSYEPKAKQQFTVWVSPDEPNPTKVVPS